MAQHWTSRIAAGQASWAASSARDPHRRFATDDADARRMRIELDAIRARFPDHA